MNHNLGCSHCGRPLEDCDCGVDYEIAYRPSASNLDDPPINSVVMWGMVGVVVLILVAVFAL